MELEWRARLGPRLSWTGHVGYLDAGYDEYIDRGVDVASSRDFPNAPEWTAGTSLVADFPLETGGALHARIDGRYQSTVRPTTDTTALLVQPGYALWNASLSWDLPDGRWHVALRGDNLGDTSYLTSGFYYPFGITTGYYGPPRTYSADAGLFVLTAGVAPMAGIGSFICCISARKRGCARRLFQREFMSITRKDIRTSRSR